MIFGDKKTFAIECEVAERIDDWVFGHILFWLCESPVGDWKDSTDLKGCLNWLNDFTSDSRNRFEPDLIGADKDTVFEWLYDPVMQTNKKGLNREPKFDDTFSRFHISHLGMSSFDRFDILLIEQPGNDQRCLWRSDDSYEIKECYIPEGEMQRVATLCQAWLGKQIQEKA